MQQGVFFFKEVNLTNNLSGWYLSGADVFSILHM